MIVDRDLLEHVAAVSRLKLTESEIEELLPQLKEILAAFDELQEVDTKGTVSSLHPVVLADAVREDIPENSLSNEVALKNTFHKKDGYIKGPKIT